MSDKSPEIINFPKVSYANPHFTRACGILYALEDTSLEQSWDLQSETGNFSIGAETLHDGNEIITVTTFGRDNYRQKGMRPTAIYKMPERSSGREYLLAKNREPSTLLRPTWVESIDQAPQELSKLLRTAEDFFDFYTSEVVDLKQVQPGTRPRNMAPYVARTIRHMLHLQSQPPEIHRSHIK